MSHSWGQSVPPSVHCPTKFLLFPLIYIPHPNHGSQTRTVRLPENNISIAERTIIYIYIYRFRRSSRVCLCVMWWQYWYIYEVKLISNVPGTIKVRNRATNWEFRGEHWGGLWAVSSLNWNSPGYFSPSLLLIPFTLLLWNIFDRFNEIYKQPVIVRNNENRFQVT